jgi:opacity protein-like surface antigen
MKQFISGALFFLACMAHAYSQNSQDKGYFSISAGPSFPIGNYGSKSINSSSAGFARVGESINISYSRLLGKRIGLSATVYGQRNPINTGALEAGFSQKKIYNGIWTGPTTEPPAEFPYTVYPNWKFEKKSWLSSSLLAGGYGQFPLDKTNHISLTTKAMIGVIYAHSPKLSGNSTTDTSSAHIEQTDKSALGFTWLVSAGVLYNLNKNIFLLANLDYTGSNEIKFKNVKETITTMKGVPGSLNFSAEQSSVTGTSKQSISTLNFHAGVGFKL